MKIAQVVTYVSRDGAFGGPISVAISQAVECARAGHDVTLIGGFDGSAVVDAPGVKVKLFRTFQLIPARFARFSGLVSPGVQSYLREYGSEFDIIHFQLSRDLISLPAALEASLRGHEGIVVQTHGMITPDSRLRARIFDSLAVRRVLRAARAVLAYRGVDDTQLNAVSRGRARIHFLRNGVEIANVQKRPLDSVTDVLFMARLHPRKRVLRFLEAALQLTREGFNLRFSIVGPDEGDLKLVERYVEEHNLSERVFYEGPVSPDRVRVRLAQADVYVLPSENEPFPVTVLDALAVGTPSVIEATCGLAPILSSTGAAIVSDGSQDSLTTAIRNLVSNRSLRESTSTAGLAAIKDHFSISAVVVELLAIYNSEEVR